MVNLDHARELFLEYAGQLEIDLCFQNFERELAELPGAYAEPRGRLHIAYEDGVPAACVALRPINESDCELKRLYVRRRFRGLGLGRRLANMMIVEARTVGYRRMLLDTQPSMVEGIALYRTMGFREISPYRLGQPSELLYFALDIPDI